MHMKINVITSNLSEPNMRLISSDGSVGEYTSTEKP